MADLEEWLDLRERIRELSERAAELEPKILADLGGHARDLTWRGRTLKLSPVTGTKRQWDWDAVREALSVPLRRRLCDQVVNPKRFIAAMESGELKREDFPYVAEKPIKEYVRVTLTS